MKKVLLILLVFLSIVGLKAQTNSLTANLNVYQMNSQFQRNMGDCIPVGISMGYLKQLNESPLSFGTEIGIALYDEKEFTINYHGNDVDMLEELGFITFSGFMRYALFKNEFSSIYGEGKLGTTSFYSSTYSEECIEGLESDMDFQGTVFNMGVGAGVMFNPQFLFGRDTDSDLWIDINVTTNSGTRFTYENDRNNEVIAAPEKTSLVNLTNNTAFKIGLVILLD